MDDIGRPLLTHALVYADRMWEAGGLGGDNHSFFTPAEAHNVFRVSEVAMNFEFLGNRRGRKILFFNSVSGSFVVIK